MEFSIKTGSPELRKTDCVAVGVFESGELTFPAKAIDKCSAGYLAGLIRSGDMDGKSGSTLLLHKLPGVAAERVLVIGLGKSDGFSEKSYLAAIASSVRCLSTLGASDAVLYLPELSVKARSLTWKIRHAVLTAQDVLYRFDHLKSGKAEAKPKLRELSFNITDKAELDAAKRGMVEGQAISAGVELAKNLGNFPANICTPSYLATEAKKMAKAHGLSVEILDRAKMEKLGMNTLLSVARGSHEPPKFIVLQHSGGASGTKPIVLVGKGVTFDTGGISLKPGLEMDEMKYDMCGAASVLGTMKAAATLKLPINLIGVIPATENMPGGAATKPGDIITSMSGKTVEILNTDAEGRLILCDALTYVERFDPDCVIDIATLTGACVIALGNVVSGLFTKNENLADELLNAGQDAQDRAWQLPLMDDYQDQLKSNFADMANIGGRAGGSITAACFLSRFTEKYPWAHLDIAGTAWRSGKDKGSTGRPVPLLVQFLITRAASAQATRKKAPRSKQK